MLTELVGLLCFCRRRRQPPLVTADELAVPGRGNDIAAGASARLTDTAGRGSGDRFRK
jgi:hypothetical protein